MKSAIQSLVRGWTSLRGRVAFELQDKLTHLPVRAAERTCDVCASQGWPCTVMAEEVTTVAATTGRGFPAPQRFVASIPGGRVLSSACTAIAPPGVVLADVSPDWKRRLEDHRALRSFVWAPSPRSLRGTAALLGNSGRNNYYHWLFDMIPRLGMIEQFEEVGRIDHWIAPATKLAAVPELLACCGIPIERVRWLGRFGHVQCERLLVSSAPSPLNGSLSSSVEFLRSRMGRHASASEVPRRRLLVLRRHTRRLANVSELDQLSARLRLEPTYLEGMAFRDQVKLFSESELVVGIHGAGLSNVAFMPAGGGVVEILPSWYQVEFFGLVARDAGLRFARVAGDRLPDSRRLGPHDDLRVDPRSLAAAIDAVMTSALQ
jgi:hypothetical protein